MAEFNNSPSELVLTLLRPTLSRFFSFADSDRSMTTEDDLVTLLDLERLSFLSVGLYDSGELLKLLSLVGCYRQTRKTYVCQ